MKPLGEMIAVMQAAKDGKPIQLRCSTAGDGNWHDFSSLEHLEWNWSHWDYRVKPEPVKPMRIVFSRFPGTNEFRFPYPIYREGRDNESEIEFIELTPEVKAKLGL